MMLSLQIKGVYYWSGACDIDSDGYEEIYFLNTDTYSGKKYSDRLIDFKKINNTIFLKKRKIN